jgi:hypothetical protein
MIMDIFKTRCWKHGPVSGKCEACAVESAAVARALAVVVAGPPDHHVPGRLHGHDEYEQRKALGAPMRVAKPDGGFDWIAGRRVIESVKQVPGVTNAYQVGYEGESVEVPRCPNGVTSTRVTVALGKVFSPVSVGYEPEPGESVFDANERVKRELRLEQARAELAALVHQTGSELHRGESGRLRLRTHITPASAVPHALLDRYAMGDYRDRVEVVAPAAQLAYGEQLDCWGYLLELKRNQSETDVDYRQRLLSRFEKSYER